MLPANFPYRKELKAKDAVERRIGYDNMTIAEKIAMLDRRLGKGIGAKKQRERLLAAGTKSAPAIVKAETVTPAEDRVIISEEKKSRKSKK
jgi:hypothetical protein